MADGIDWANLRLITFNRGNRNSFDDVWRIVTTPGTAGVALQEMGDQQDMLDRMQDRGLGVLRFDDVPGAQNSPFVWHKDKLRLIDSMCKFLLPEQTISGTHNLQKNFVGGRFLHLASGQEIVAGSAHNIQHQQIGSRATQARLFTQALLTHLDGIGVPTLVGADWNITRNGPSLQPLRQAGWKSDAFAGRPLITWSGHDARDMWWWEDADGSDVLRFQSHFTRDGDSDHKAVVVDWDIRMRVPGSGTDPDNKDPEKIKPDLPDVAQGGQYEDPGKGRIIDRKSFDSVTYANGRRERFTADRGVLDPRRALAARYASDGILIAAPYSAPRQQGGAR